MTYLQLEHIERLLHLDFDEIDDAAHALVRCMLDHVVDVMLKNEDIIKTGLKPHELSILVADAHYECVDELIRHGFYTGGTTVMTSAELLQRLGEENKTALKLSTTSPPDCPPNEKINKNK
jgi:hypothetical protein